MARKPDAFVARPEYEDALSALLGTSEVHQHSTAPVALTTALKGAGGFGKTALAQALCQSEQVRARFSYGILWATIGLSATEHSLVSKIRDLLRWWHQKEPPYFETLEASAAALREEFSGNPVLLVLDDVWRPSDLISFVGWDPPAALLITSRDSRCLPPTARQVVVDALKLGRAVELLSQGVSPAPHRSDLEDLARRLGEWPLLLRLVNSQIREECRLGHSAAEALRSVDRVLDSFGMTAFDVENEEARHLAVSRTIEASLDRLSPEAREAFERLVVFQEDEIVSMDVLELLWENPRHEVDRLCRRLSEMSLLHLFDSVERRIQLHDVMRSYLIQKRREGQALLHARFVERYGARSAASDERSLVTQYFVSRLPYHLLEAGKRTELVQLLFSHDWLKTKLQFLGVNAAIADYEAAGEEDCSLVAGALRLARPVLDRDPSQLPGQLLGRLSSSRSAVVQGLLVQARASTSGVWLCPLGENLETPQGIIVESFPAHEEEIRAVVQLDSDTYATASEGVRIWQIGTGDAVLELPVGPVGALAAAPGKRLLVGSDDGSLRLFACEDPIVSQQFLGHKAVVTSVHVFGDEFVSGAEDGTMFRWTFGSSAPLCQYVGHAGRINSVSSLDDRTIVSVGGDRTLRVWAARSGKLLKTVEVSVFPGEAMQASGFQEVIVGTFAGEIQVWKPLSTQGRPRRVLRYRSVGLKCLCVLGRDLGASSVGPMTGLQLWNPREGTVGPQIHVPGGEITALARFGRDRLLCGTKSGRISVLSIDALRRRQQDQEVEAIFSVAPLGNMRAASTRQHRVVIWNAEDGSVEKVLEMRAGRVNGLCAVGSGALACALSDGAVEVVSSADGSILCRFRATEPLAAIACYRGELLVAGPQNPLTGKAAIRAWDLVEGTELSSLPGIQGGVASLLFADGPHLFLGTYDGPVFQMDLSGRSSPRNAILQGHSKGVVSMAMVREDLLATGSLDSTIRLWDLDSHVLAREIPIHADAVTGVVRVSSSLLASCSQDRSLRICNVDSGRVLASFESDAGFTSLALMTDQQTLVAGDMAGRTLFFRIEGMVSFENDGCGTEGFQ